MQRRQLIKFGTLAVILPFTHALVGCGGGEADTGAQAVPDAGGETPIFTFESTVDVGHQHAVTVGHDTLVDTPGGGASLETTLENAHRHTVELTRGDLDQIVAGESVTKETSSVAGHTHRFTFTVA